MSSPFEPFAKLGRAAREASHKLGFELHRFLPEPDLEGNTHKVTMVFKVDPERVGRKPDAEQEAVLAEIAEATRRAEEERRVEQTKRDLRRLEEQLRDPDGGIL